MVHVRSIAVSLSSLIASFLLPFLPSVHLRFLPPSFILTSVTLFAPFLLSSPLPPTHLLLSSLFPTSVLSGFHLLLSSLILPLVFFPRLRPPSYYLIPSLPPSIPSSLLAFHSNSPSLLPSSFPPFRYFFHPASHATLFATELLHSFFLLLIQQAVHAVFQMFILDSKQRQCTFPS